MNFFATWCGACRLEMRGFVSIANEYVQSGEVVFVGMDCNEEDDTVRAFRKEFAIPYPIAMDAKGGFTDNIGVKGFPTTFFFDREGRVARVWTGSLEESVVRGYIAQIAAPPSPAPVPSGSAS